MANSITFLAESSVGNSLRSFMVLWFKLLITCFLVSFIWDVTNVQKSMASAVLRIAFL